MESQGAEDRPDEAEARPAGWVSRRRLILVAVVGALAVAVTSVMLYRESPDQKHRRVVERIQRWVRPEVGTSTEPEARGIHEIKQALYTASGNWPLWYRANAPTEKLAEVADYLDRTDGADFKTYAGALKVLGMLEAVSPTLHEYPWIERLREMQVDGTIPPDPRKPSDR